jgi:hypothetical protein
MYLQIQRGSRKPQRVGTKLTLKKMKNSLNLNAYGVEELSHTETLENEGGNPIVTFVKYCAKVIRDVITYEMICDAGNSIPKAGAAMPPHKKIGDY